MSVVEFIMTYMPSLVGITSTIASIIVCIKKVKQSIGDTKDTNAALKKVIKEKIESDSVVVEAMKSEISELKAANAAQAEELKALKENVASTVEASKKTEELIDNTTSIRNQLEAMLNKGE